MLEWLIVGGGVHGTAMSNHLLKTCGVDADKICVVDPHDQPLAAWRHYTANTGMRFLRSPGAHSLDVGPGALFAYAKNAQLSESHLFSRYDRPSLSLFDAHCDALIETQQLQTLRYQAQATLLTRSNDSSFVLQTSRDLLKAKRVILSLGPSTELAFPAWATTVGASKSLTHIFSSEFELHKLQSNSIIVVGSGISAAQCALALSERHPGKVTILHSRPLQTRQFDADPCWLERRCLSLLSAKKDFSERRRVVDNARHRGSFPEEIKRQLTKALETKQLVCQQGTVETAQVNDSNVVLNLSDGCSLEAETVLLATGFAQQIPGGEFLRATILELDLRCAPCGYPVTDRYLQWQKNLFVTGALAELTLGPSARNIIGARLAAQRIFALKRGAKHGTQNNFYYFRKRRTG